MEQHDLQRHCRWLLAVKHRVTEAKPAAWARQQQDCVPNMGAVCVLSCELINVPIMNCACVRATRACAEALENSHGENGCVKGYAAPYRRER